MVCYLYFVKFLFVLSYRYKNNANLIKMIVSDQWFTLFLKNIIE